MKQIKKAKADPPWSRTFLKKAIPDIIKLVIEINKIVMGSGSIKKQPSQPLQNETEIHF